MSNPTAVSPKRKEANPVSGRRGSVSLQSKMNRVPISIRKKGTVFIGGRPPWYSKEGQVKEAFLIGCAGGSASGKTTVAEEIIRLLEVPWVLLLSMDSYYKILNAEQLKLAHQSMYNFDHPDAFDFDLLKKSLKDLKQGKQIEVPQYDFTIHQRLPEAKTVYGAGVIVFEGIFALYDPEVCDMMDLRIFVDTDDDIRLARRLKRDISERGRDLIGVIDQYSRFVKPAFDQFIRPTIAKADVIVPRGGDNKVAIDLIAKHIRHKLAERGFNFRQELANSTKNVPSNVKVLRSTKQLKVLHTIIRDCHTSRDDFIFYSQRLFRLLIEDALNFLPFQQETVITPVNEDYRGTALNEAVCGVSIIRAGGALESALHHIQKKC